jgi:hypothetical protein
MASLHAPVGARAAPRALPRRSAACEALLGGTASAAAALFTNPIDVVRARLQLQSGPRAASSGGGVAIATTLARGGGLQAGLGAAVGYNVLLNATRFSLFGALSSPDAGACTPLQASLVAGGVAGALSAPLARLRTLQQLGHSRTAAWRALAHAPLAGATPWAVRNAGHTAVIFWLYEAISTSGWVDARLEAALGGAAERPSALTHLVSSLCAATVSCFLLNPLDVCATRVFHSSAEARRGASSSAAPREPLARAAFRGLGANLLRTVPHTALTFLFLEALRKRVPATAPSPMPQPAAVRRVRAPSFLSVSAVH